MKTQQSACPVCDGKGFVTTVRGRRVRRRDDRCRTMTPHERGRAAAVDIALAFHKTFVNTSEVLRRSVGQAFEDARRAFEGLYPEPPVSELKTIACELGAFPDFPIADQGKPIVDVVYSAILNQFTARRAASLLESSEGRLKVRCLVATLASSLQILGLQTRGLWEMADALGGAP